MDGTGVPLLLARLWVAGWFIYLAYQKLAGPPMNFAKSVRDFGLLPLEPAWLINSVAIFLPWIEMFCGLALLLGLLIPGASLMVLVLLIAFTVGIHMKGMALFNEGRFDTICAMEFDCGCGTDKEIFCQKMLINLSLILAAWICWKSQSRRMTLESWWKGRKPQPPTPVAA